MAEQEQDRLHLRPDRLEVRQCELAGGFLRVAGDGLALATAGNGSALFDSRTASTTLAVVAGHAGFDFDFLDAHLFPSFQCGRGRLPHTRERRSR